MTVKIKDVVRWSRDTTDRMYLVINIQEHARRSHANVLVADLQADDDSVEQDVPVTELQSVSRSEARQFFETLANLE